MANITWLKRKGYLKINYFKYYNRIIKILVESGSSPPSLTSSATTHRPNTKTDKSASSWHIPLVYRTDSIGRFQHCASFGFFQIGHLLFTKITFFDTCQKIVSTHAPSFGIIYFVPKLPQPAFKAIPSTPCIRLTPYDRVKFFFAPGLLPSVRTNPMRRFTFRLFTYPDRAINITFRPCIDNKSPLATEPPLFLLQQKPLVFL